MYFFAAPGNVPVASMATPILNIPTATSSEGHRASVSLATETTSVTTNQTRTTVNVVPSNHQMVKAIIRPSSTNEDKSETQASLAILKQEPKPKGKAMPINLTNAVVPDPLSFRQILPKSSKNKPLPSAGSMRPTQVMEREIDAAAVDL